MKTRVEIHEEVEYRESCARMWDTIAANVPSAALQATIRASAHRECADALKRRAKLYDWLYWAFIISCALGGFILLATS